MATSAMQANTGSQIPNIDAEKLFPTLSSLSSLRGFPGVLSRETVKEAINADLRGNIHQLFEEVKLKPQLNSTQIEIQDSMRSLKEGENTQGDFTNLNEILGDFVFEIPEQDFMADLLGTTLSVNVKGSCGGFAIGDIVLDYQQSGSTLTYDVAATGVDVKCQILLAWDFGVLDVDDKLKIRVILNDNSFRISVTLNGSPPSTSTFHGCEANINVNSISADGGFSADILNDLEPLILNIVKQEKQFISDLLCGFITDLSSTVDELLIALGDTLAPYLTRLVDVDPLELENNLEPDVELLDLTDSTLGEVLQIFIDNLDGVVGAFQINTLIELNLLNDEGIFVFETGLELRRERRLESRGLQDTDTSQPTEECSFIRRRKLGAERDLLGNLKGKLLDAFEDSLCDMISVPQLTTAVEQQVQDALERKLKVEQDRGLQISVETFFVLNSVNIPTIEIVGLNTFQDTDYLEIIGEQTLRSVLKLEGIALRVTIILDIILFGTQTVETIVAIVPINGIDVTISFLLGLDKAKVEEWSLGTFLPVDNAFDCVLSSLVVAGVSELSVTVQEISPAQVSGVIDTGIDNVINAAIKGALATYEELILLAIPNIFQNNVTVILNDFLESFIRTEKETAVCPEVEEGTSALEGSGLFDFGEDSETGETVESANAEGDVESTTFFGGGESVTTFDYTDNRGSTTSGTTTSSGYAGYTTNSGTTTLDEKSGSFVGVDSSIYQGSVVVDSNGAVNGFIDFRDLLLPANESMVLGGTGMEPYGSLIAMGFEALKSQMLTIDIESGLSGINSGLLQPLTESQSGVNGLLRFPQQLLNMTFDTTDLSFLSSLLQRVEIVAFDATIGNLNTILNPVKFLEPTDQAHVLENIFHFGPVTGRPLNISIGINITLDGMDSPLTLKNEMDISALADELDVFTNFQIMIPTQNFLKFPLTDILNFNCWLALIQAPNMDLGGDEKIDNALAIKSFVMKVVSMAMDLTCIDCSSTSLPRIIDIFQDIGATRVLGNRAGLLLEEIMTSDVAAVFLTEFIQLGDEAGRRCPHSPNFNTTRADNTMGNLTSVKVPALSSRSIDTIAYASILTAEVFAIIFSESHLANYEKPSDGLSRQGENAYGGANLLDFTNMTDGLLPYGDALLQTVRDSLGGDESESLGINQIISTFLGAGGNYSQEVSDVTFIVAGITITIHTVNVSGLDSFTSFDILRPVAPQTLKNSFAMDKLSLTVEITAKAGSSEDPPQTYKVSLEMNDLNATAFSYVAIDEKELASITVGSLMNFENILPCFLTTAYDIHFTAMEMLVGSISNLSIDGLFTETSKMVEASVMAMFNDFGSEITQAINLVFDGTFKALINDYLRTHRAECKPYDLSSVPIYVDFREMFWADEENKAPLYGDIFPFLKEKLQNDLLSLNPVTMMPKINDVLVAPLTENLSGVAGALKLAGEFFSFSYQGFQELGIDSAKLKLRDALVINMDTLGAPLLILEPNKTDGSLLDNRASLGTDDRPFRLSVKSHISLSGSLLNSDDELELFSELKAAPFFAVLLARVGAEELLTFPLQYIADMHCWVAMIAAPALEEIGKGQTQVDSVIGMPYAELLFSSMHVGALCDNCTLPGIKAVPDILQLWDKSGTMEVLLRRSLEVGSDVLGSDFSQVWFMNILQDSARRCPHAKSTEETSIVLASADFPEMRPRWLETGAFATAVVAQTIAVVLAETVAAIETEIQPAFKTIAPKIHEGTRMVDFTALDAYPIGGLVEYFIDGANTFIGAESVDPETGKKTLGINELLADNPLLALDTLSTEFEGINVTTGGVTIELKEVQLSGFNTFTKLRVMSITGPETFQNEMSWKNLEMEIVIVVDAEDVNGSGQQDEKMSFSLVLEVEDVEASLELLLALDYDVLTNLELGSFLRLSKIFPCIQASVRHLEISDVIFKIGKIKKLRLEGFPSKEMAGAAESFESLLLEKFGKTLASAAPSLFSVAIRPLLNNAFTSYLRDSDFECNQFALNKESGLIDFRDLLFSEGQSKRYGGSGEATYGDLMRIFYSMLQLQLMMAHPEEGIEMLRPILGDISISGVLLDQGIQFGMGDIKADISLTVSDFEMRNLDSLGKPLSLLSPVKQEPHELNNSATLGIGERPLSIGARFYLHVKGLGTCRRITQQNTQSSLFLLRLILFIFLFLALFLFLGNDDIINDFDLKLDIHSASIVLTALLKLSAEAFVKFPLRDILNFNCWLAMIPPPPLDEYGILKVGAEPTAALTHLDIIASKLDMKLNCHNCTSPALLKFSRLLQAPGSSEDLTDLANRLVGSVTSKLGGAFVQDQINRFLAEAPRHCPHSSGYDPNAHVDYKIIGVSKISSPSSFISMLITIMVPLLFVILAAFGVNKTVQRRQKQWLKALPSERVFLIQQRQDASDQREKEINELTSSMYTSKSIPFIWRQIVPFIVLVNILFFLSGHLSKGGRILIDFVLAGESFRIDDFFIFSIGQSTIDLWHAGGKALALFILLFSGIWPYTKQLITLALWFLPPSVVSCTLRGKILVWLDILAKWSMIDIMVMLITVAGFR